jgi:ribonuclease III
MPRASRPSVRQSTTSPLVAEPQASAPDPAELLRLIEGLPAGLRERAFTHPSFVEDRSRSYERLEFLGDSVLDLAVAQELYERFPEFSEGRLTKAWAYVVSRSSCADVGRLLDLGERLAEGAGAAGTHELARLGRNRNVLAALVEAVLGALYLEHGFEPIRAAIVHAFAERLEYAVTSHVDFKTELQEALARSGRSVSYAVLETEGPPHERYFTCAALIDGERAGVGTGTSKKAAEQAAAREALERVTAADDI